LLGGKSLLLLKIAVEAAAAGKARGLTDRFQGGVRGGQKGFGIGELQFQEETGEAYIHSLLDNTLALPGGVVERLRHRGESKPFGEMLLDVKEEFGGIVGQVSRKGFLIGGIRRNLAEGLKSCHDKVGNTAPHPDQLASSMGINGCQNTGQLLPTAIKIPGCQVVMIEKGFQKEALILDPFRGNPLGWLSESEKKRHVVGFHLFL
jgi:hypothetical protein